VVPLDLYSDINYWNKRSTLSFYSRLIVTEIIETGKINMNFASISLYMLFIHVGTVHKDGGISG
jgi:hypothetical protein